MADENEIRQAEHDLIDLLRGHDSPEFTLTISCIDGRWMVRMVEGPKPDDVEMLADGSGLTFADAWNSQVDPRLRGPLTFPEQARLGRVRVIEGDAK